MPEGDLNKDPHQMMLSIATHSAKRQDDSASDQLTLFTDNAPLETIVTTPPSGFHPSYSASDADIVLSSSDNVLFGVHSIILKHASGVFNDMLSMARDVTEKSSDPIYLSEDGVILKALLDISYPCPGLPDDSPLDFLHELALVARKYDMPGAMNCIRRHMFLLTPEPGPSSLDRYGIACEFGWEREAKLASTGTLSVDLRTEESLKRLRKMDCPSVLQLQDFRRSRRDLLDSCLKNDNKMADWSVIHPTPGRFGFFGPFCPGYRLMFQSTPWLLFRHLIGQEMEKCCRGDFLSRGFWERSEFNDLWTMSCQSCKDPLIRERAKFVTMVAELLDKLPTSV